MIIILVKKYSRTFLSQSINFIDFFLKKIGINFVVFSILVNHEHFDLYFGILTTVHITEENHNRCLTLMS